MFFGGVRRKMNLLFDTPLPLSYCEIWLALVRSQCSKSGEHVCVCVRLLGVFSGTTLMDEFEM